MASEPQVTWQCPLCSKEVVPYGKSCPDKMTCRHWLDDDLNVNGHWYQRQEALKAGQDAERTRAGISEISDESIGGM